jgi:hypothetical protein
MIIGICGRSRSGKDTFADFLLKHLKNARKISFATPLKDSMNTLFGFTCNKDEVDPFWKIKPRDAYIAFGTEVIRDRLGFFLNLPDKKCEDFFIHRMKKEIMNMDKQDVLIIPDVRFQNEINFIKLNGGKIVKIKRDGLKILEHKSECPDSLSDVDYMFYNNGTIEELEDKVLYFKKHFLDN